MLRDVGGRGELLFCSNNFNISRVEREKWLHRYYIYVQGVCTLLNLSTSVQESVTDPVTCVSVCVFVLFFYFVTSQSFPRNLAKVRPF